jgi:hypothetical protein
MPIVTVLEKLYGSGSPDTLETKYSSLCRGLKVNLEFAGTIERGWVQIDVSGEDETAALSFLDREIGLAPVSSLKVSKFSVFRGKVIFSGKNENELLVDLGVFSPKVYDAVLPVQRLRAQLADGKDFPLQKLVELFCLYDNFPLEVKVIQDPKEDQEKTVEARLSEEQVSLFSSWVRSRFDRLIVLGGLFSEVERIVKLSRHYRDIIRLDSLGTLEQVIFCKLGTDAVGLIPKLGRFLPDTVLIPFSPKKILEAVDSHSFNW